MALENPALNELSFERGMEEAGAEARTMTASGTYAIAGLLFVIVVAAAAFGFSQVEIVTVGGRKEALTPSWTWLVFLLTLIVGIVGAFAYRAAPITSVLYALGEGSLLGIASRYYELRFEGIVSQALVATLCVFLAVYLLYALRVVKVTSRLATVVVAATGGVRAALSGGLAALFGRGGSALPVRSHAAWDRDKRPDRRIGRAEPHARFRLHREGGGGGGAEVHAVVRGLRTDALSDLDLRLRSATHRVGSIQRVGDLCQEAGTDVLEEGRKRPRRRIRIATRG
jgi:hypothetical protein